MFNQDFSEMTIHRKLIFTNHALKRMTERRFKPDHVLYMFQTAEKTPLRYKRWLCGGVRLGTNGFRFRDILMVAEAIKGGYKLITIFDLNDKKPKSVDPSPTPL